jgi:putative membrane protein
MTREKILTGSALVLASVLIVSGLHPYDRGTWALEVFPVVILIPLLVWTYRRFPLTSLLYGLIFLHSLVLILGGVYTYARVPLGYFLADLLHSSRNPYDKIGHFFQGFVPALAAREILLRGHYVRRGKMAVFLILSVVLAISALYELLEWAAAVLLGQGAEDFLGTQGYIWDTQTDMGMALIGGIASFICLSRQHDRQMKALPSHHS